MKTQNGVIPQSVTDFMHRWRTSCWAKMLKMDSQLWLIHLQHIWSIVGKLKPLVRHVRTFCSFYFTPRLWHQRLFQLEKYEDGSYWSSLRCFLHLQWYLQFYLCLCVLPSQFCSFSRTTWVKQGKAFVFLDKLQNLSIFKDLREQESLRNRQKTHYLFLSLNWIYCQKTRIYF